MDSKGNVNWNSYKQELDKIFYREGKMNSGKRNGNKNSLITQIFETKSEMIKKWRQNTLWGKSRFSDVHMENNTIINK